MKPIIIVYHPFVDIVLIKVYTPQIKDQQTISINVSIDKCSFIMELKEDDSWSCKGTQDHYDLELISFIQKKIEQFYINQPDYEKMRLYHNYLKMLNKPM